MKEFWFAKEKNIHGKKDKGRHDGKASEIRRLAVVLYDLKEYEKGGSMGQEPKPCPNRDKP